uniref:Endonuclease/exonuclease/phosphatase domain-containing protein n=1 Tax=Micrurus corallinus TaxID=54390 RepID=A0A2D4EQW4_MICCO
MILSYDIIHGNKLTSLLAWAASCPHPLIFLGDLNLPLINWTLNERTSEPINATLYNAVTTLGLNQLVYNNIRLNNFLDLIFCNSSNSIYDLQIQEPFSNGDHSMIDFCLNLHHLKKDHNDGSPKYN